MGGSEEGGVDEPEEERDDVYRYAYIRAGRTSAKDMGSAVCVRAPSVGFPKKRCKYPQGRDEGVRRWRAQLGTAPVESGVRETCRKVTFISAP